METKTCTKCGAVLPATTEYFAPNKRIKCGLSSHCRECRRKDARRYGAEHREERIAYGKEYYQNNKERWTKYGQQYREENRDAIYERQHRWYLENRERILRERKEYGETNREDIARRRHETWKKNRAAYLQRKQEYYKGNREEILSKQKEKYWANPDHRRAISRMAAQRWRTNHPEEDREKHKKWKQENKEQVRVSSHRRRAAILRASGSHTAEDVKRIYEQQGGRCYWCQKELNGIYHIDHRIPLSRGGSNDASNLVIACPTCNMRKGSKLPYEWCGRLL